MSEHFSYVKSTMDTYINRFLPVVPAKFYSSVSSTFVAAAVGGTYGFIGRRIYPTSGISPLHYAIWLALAFQIKQFVLYVEHDFCRFLGICAYLEKLEHLSEDKLDLDNLIRYRCWQVIQLKNKTLQAIDDAFCKIFAIRPYPEITPKNVYQASFIEMCRYRIWPVFKEVVLNASSLRIAYQFSNQVGFTLPNHTNLPLLIMIRSIVEQIILVPLLHIFERSWKGVLDNLENDPIASADRKKWSNWCLPSL